MVVSAFAPILILHSADGHASGPIDLGKDVFLPTVLITTAIAVPMIPGTVYLGLATETEGPISEGRAKWQTGLTTPAAIASVGLIGYLGYYLTIKDAESRETNYFSTILPAMAVGLFSVPVTPFIHGAWSLSNGTRDSVPTLQRSYFLANNTLLTSLALGSTTAGQLEPAPFAIATLGFSAPQTVGALVALANKTAYQGEWTTIAAWSGALTLYGGVSLTAALLRSSQSRPLQRKAAWTVVPNLVPPGSLQFPSGYRGLIASTEW